MALQQRSLIVSVLLEHFTAQEEVELLKDSRALLKVGSADQAEGNHTQDRVQGSKLSHATTVHHCTQLQRCAVADASVNRTTIHIAECRVQKQPPSPPRAKNSGPQSASASNPLASAQRLSGLSSLFSRGVLHTAEPPGGPEPDPPSSRSLTPEPDGDHRTGLTSSFCTDVTPCLLNEGRQLDRN
ncbi:hypothetical protein H920_03315 [Fukomys damarensis]|uniref:Uncharacterized protein n=1 Tax=Fukomys damarensis TaxID=885580 RepID=A0A091DY22_FUKDA|nr:hypothetical protein H920_03315 [Fukomys damarensis]